MRTSIVGTRFGTTALLLMAAGDAFDFGAILNKGMGEIEDAPEFANLPDGTHVLNITEIKQKTVGKGDDKMPAIQFKYTYVEPVELAAGVTAPAAGTIVTEQFTIGEQGLPYLKRHVKDVWDKMPEASLSDVLKALQGVNVAVTAKSKKFESKSEKGKMLDGWNSVAMVLV